MKFNKLFSLPLLMLGIFSLGAVVGAVGTSKFSDVPEDHFAAGAIEWAAELGLIKGDEGKDTARPNDPVSRGELSVVMQRYHEYLMNKDGMHDEKMHDEKMHDEDKHMEKEEMEPTYLYLQNLSGDQPLAPGVVVIHDKNVSLDFEGELAPAELETLAEVGDPTAFAELVEGMDGVHAVYTTDLILPGESMEIMLEDMMMHDMEGMDEMMMDEMMYEGKVVSILAMPAASNDGYAFVDSLELKVGEYQKGVNHDAGFEENTELGSGFEGGQPDPEQGEANLDNGEATEPQEAVMVHEQLTDYILKLWVK